MKYMRHTVFTSNLKNKEEIKRKKKKQAFLLLISDLPASKGDQNEIKNVTIQPL